MKKSLRLNKDLRTNILNSIMQKFDESNPKPTSELPTLKELKGILADKVHTKVYGKYNLDSVPQDLLNTSSYISIQTPNDSIEHIDFSYTPTGVSSFSHTYKVSTSKSKVEYVFTEDDTLWTEHQEARELTKVFNKEVDAYLETRSIYKGEVDQVLQGVNTTGQLLEQWPEIEEFIPESIANPSKINLPNVSVSKLNEQLK